jgi:hypothetical protein
VKLNINGTLYDVGSPEEASRIWCNVRDRLGLGATDMYDRCGEVRNSAGKLVAVIAYNGKIERKP